MLKDNLINFAKKFGSVLVSFLLGVLASLVVARYDSEIWITLKHILDISPTIFFIIAFVIIIVSGIFCMVSVDKLRKDIGYVNKENSNSLQKIEFILGKEKSLGILSIESRSSYSSDKYKNIFNATYSELVYSGITLYNTINKDKHDDLRQTFMNMIIRLIKNNKPIKILLLKPTQDDVTKRKQEFVEFVKETYKKLHSETITNDLITKNFLIKESEYLPYYIVKNENILHIGYYTLEKFANNLESNLYIFEANAGNGYGKYYYDDFIKYFDNSADFEPECRKIISGDL